MKRPFAVKLRWYELLGGLLWLCVYAFALGPMISPALRALGLPGERVWRNADEIPEDAGYLTLLLLLPDRETER